MEHKQKNTLTKGFHYACSSCNSTKYCPDCLKGYNLDDKFCSKCGNSLKSMKELANQDCPICSKKKIHGFSKILPIKVVKQIDYSKKLREALRHPPSGGVIIPRYCHCGNYRPRSTRGIIDDSCANCGGKKKEIIIR